jgi:hypothetical protein
MRVQFLYWPLISWNFKSANKLAPCTQFHGYRTAFATNVVPFVSYSLTKMSCVNIKAALAACKGDTFQPIAANVWWITNMQPVHPNVRPVVHT